MLVICNNTRNVYQSTSTVYTEIPHSFTSCAMINCWPKRRKRKTRERKLVHRDLLLTELQFSNVIQEINSRLSVADFFWLFHYTTVLLLSVSRAAKALKRKQCKDFVCDSSFWTGKASEVLDSSFQKQHCVFVFSRAFSLLLFTVCFWH